MSRTLSMNFRLSRGLQIIDIRFVWKLLVVSISVWILPSSPLIFTLRGLRFVVISVVWTSRKTRWPKLTSGVYIIHTYIYIHYPYVCSMLNTQTQDMYKSKGEESVVVLVVVVVVLLLLRSISISISVISLLLTHLPQHQHQNQPHNKNCIPQPRPEE